MIEWQTKATDKALSLHNCIEELKQEREQLRQQLEDARTEPPVVVTPLASNLVKETAKSWKVLADRLNQDSIRIRNERVKLTEQVKQLQAVNKQQADDLAHANFTIDVCREQLVNLRQTPQSTSSMPQTPATLLGTQLPTHQEMGGYVRLPTASGPCPLSVAMPDSLSVPTSLTPMRDADPRLSDAGTPTLPRLTPQPSASHAAPPPQDQEEDIDSEPQEGPESRQ